MVVTVVALAEPGRGVTAVALDEISERVGWIPDGERERARLTLVLALTAAERDEARADLVRMTDLAATLAGRVAVHEASEARHLARLANHLPPSRLAAWWGTATLGWDAADNPRWALPALGALLLLAAALVRW